MRKKISVSIPKETYDFIIQTWEKVQMDNIHKKRVTVSEVVDFLIRKGREAGEYGI